MHQTRFRRIDKKAIYQTNELYRDLLGPRQNGAVKIARLLYKEGVEITKINQFLAFEGFTNDEAMQIIKKIINEHGK